MTRKLLSILVALLMVLAIVPMGALAAEAGEQSDATAAADAANDNSITKIEINGFVEPEWNGTVDTSAYTVPEDAHYSIYEASWAYYGSRASRSTKAIWLDDGDTFDNAHVYYYCSIAIEPEEGYEFAGTVELLINGKSDFVDADYSEYDSDYGMYFVCTIDFTVDDPDGGSDDDENVITSVNVINFVVPTWNGSADTSGYSVPEDAHYSVNYDLTFWKYYGNGSGYPEYFNDATVNYYLQVAVTPENGYTFSDDCEFLLNGDASYVDSAFTAYNASYNVLYTLSIDFTVENPGGGGDEQIIDTIEILGYEDPVFGASADVSGYTVPEDAHYYIDFNRTYWVAYDDEAWSSSQAEYFDDEAIIYYFTCAIYPEDGYTFASDVTVLLGGSSESYDDYYSGYNSDYGYFRIYSIDFMVEDPNAILGIEVNFTDPAWNATAADSEPTIPEDAQYTIYDYAWAYEEGSDYGELSDEDVFDNELARYYLYIVLEPNEGLGFSAARTVVTINGQDYMVDPDYTGYYSNYRLYVVYTIYYTVVDPATLVAAFDFETDPEAEGWKFVDKDNDHTADLNWYWEYMNEDYPVMSGYQGKGLLTSASYVNGDGAYAPDNWAISPAIRGALYMSFYVSGQDASWCEEHFAVYAGTTARPDQMTELLAETEATGEYIRYEIDLSDFAGQTIYIAFRHFNCEDQFRLNIDHVVLTRPIVWGDADMDCQITAADALLIMRYVQGIITEDDIDVRYLDVNADGSIDFVDALLVLRKAMDIFTDPFPAELPPEDEPVVD